jgi:hypothetical protein
MGVENSRHDRKLACAIDEISSQIGGFDGRTARPIYDRPHHGNKSLDRTAGNESESSTVLNKFSPSGHGEAQVQYLDGDFRVISPGTYVRCAVTDARIPLDELKYWSVDLQEAYAIPDAVLQRHFPRALKS